MVLTEKQKNEIISFCADLVKIPEESGREERTARLVRQKMEDLGYDEVTVDRYGSVLGVLRGCAPGPVLLFDGHMDVVPVRDKWDHDPFGAEISGGRMWGRGTTDMKGALAAMICAAAFLERTEFCGKIIVSASVAEELLVGAALDRILEDHHVDAVVVGEPTAMKLGHAEKGRASIEMISHGTVAHSSRPDLGDNAVYRMMEAAAKIREMARRSDPLLGDEVIELVEISSLPSPGNGSIPGRCRALWECRLLPGETESEFLERLKEALEGIDRTEIKTASYKLSAYTGEELEMDDYLPGWTADEKGSGLLNAAADSLRECGLAVDYYAAPYGCNALSSAAMRGIPTVILGPGDIGLAHKPNENIRLDELLAAAAVYGEICRKYSLVK